MDASNVWSVVGGSTVTGLFALLVAKISKHYDVRAAAEAALIGSGPAIIGELNKRLAYQQEETDKVWKSLQEIFKNERQCQDELREQRHQNRDLLQKVSILVARVDTLEGKHNV